MVYERNWPFLIAGGFANADGSLEPDSIKRSGEVRLSERVCAWANIIFARAKRWHLLRQ